MGWVSGERLRSSWRPILIVVVALGLGGVVGVLVEHQRAVDRSNESSTPTSAPAAGNAWFGDNMSEACPAAERWYGALGSAIYTVLNTKAPWNSTRENVLASWSVISDEYREMMKVATPAGKTELELMATSLEQAKPAIAASPSAQAFLSAPNPDAASSQRLGLDYSFLVQIARTCTS